MTPKRAKLIVAMGLVLLVCVTLQVGLLVSSWSGSSRDWFCAIVAVCQFALALSVLVGVQRARKRGGSEAARLWITRSEKR